LQTRREERPCRKLLRQRLQRGGTFGHPRLVQAQVVDIGDLDVAILDEALHLRIDVGLEPQRVHLRAGAQVLVGLPELDRDPALPRREQPLVVEVVDDRDLRGAAGLDRRFHQQGAALRQLDAEDRAVVAVQAGDAGAENLLHEPRAAGLLPFASEPRSRTGRRPEGADSHGATLEGHGHEIHVAAHPAFELSLHGLQGGIRHRKVHRHREEAAAVPVARRELGPFGDVLAVDQQLEEGLTGLARQVRRVRHEPEPVLAVEVAVDGQPVELEGGVQIEHGGILERTRAFGLRRRWLPWGVAAI
jgi:hypothetical protein